MNKRLKREFEKVDRLVAMQKDIMAVQLELSELRESLREVETSNEATILIKVINVEKKEVVIREYEKNKAEQYYKKKIRKRVKKVSKLINRFRAELLPDEYYMAVNDDMTIPVELFDEIMDV